MASTNINHIIDNIYISNYETALNQEVIKKLNINYIFDCTKNNKHKTNNVIAVPLDDPPTQETLNYLYANHKKIYELIDLYVKNKKTLLVHCQMGQQRSVTIVALYIMKKYKLSLKATTEFLKKKRPMCFFGKNNFEKFLLDYEKTIN